VKRLALIFALAVLASIVVIPAAFATSTTDLNNIPITDTLKAGTMEWDVFARWNDNPDFPHYRLHCQIATRLFAALFDNLEFGMAWGISRPAGPVEFDVKYKVLDEYNGSPVSLAVGAEGITGNNQRTGMDPTYYAVVGLHDVHLGGWWDWYVGVANNPMGFDSEDNSIFGGFKYWINDCQQINADYKGYEDPIKGWACVISLGFNYDWVNHVGFQGWLERDSVIEDTILVLQLTVRGDMRDLTAEVSDPE
jgi:hypothetical protein